jgi:hypothetical protein
VVGVANRIMENIGNVLISDGVQNGVIFINGNDCNINDELSSIISQ